MNAHCHDYPDEPGHRGVSTSVEAADAIASVHGKLQRQALQVIRDAGYFGITAEELAHRLNLPRETIQPSEPSTHLDSLKESLTPLCNKAVE